MSQHAVIRESASHEPHAAQFEGWHDSSLDLRRGLVVTEHGALDPLAEALRSDGAAPPESLTRWIRPRH